MPIIIARKHIVAAFEAVMGDRKKVRLNYKDYDLIATPIAKKVDGEDAVVGFTVRWKV